MKGSQHPCDNRWPENSESLQDLRRLGLTLQPDSCSQMHLKQVVASTAAKAENRSPQFATPISGHNSPTRTKTMASLINIFVFLPFLCLEITFPLNFRTIYKDFHRRLLSQNEESLWFLILMVTEALFLWRPLFSRNFLSR